MKHFTTLREVPVPQILSLVRSGLEFKRIIRAERNHLSSIGKIPQVASGKTLGILFTKRSTRTRISAETGWARMGGHPMFLGSNDIQLGAGGESWKDTAIVVSSMVDGILARVGSHSEIEHLVEHSSVPVINALSAKYHPLQLLADLMTLYETFVPEPLRKTDATLPLPPLPTSLTVTWVGDANNILNSLLVTFPRLGINVNVATPSGYGIDKDVLDFAMGSCGRVRTFSSPSEAVKDAQVIITDTWVSMGQESEKAARLKAFSGYQVTEAMAKAGGADPNWKFMHCLPRKAEEVDDDVFYNKTRSLVFEEAENRKYTIMAVFDYIFKQNN